MALLTLNTIGITYVPSIQDPVATYIIEYFLTKPLFVDSFGA